MSQKFKRGDRIILQKSSSYLQSRTILNESMETMDGCIVDNVELKNKRGTEKYFCIILDYPLNDRPSDIEVELASDFMVACNIHHFILLPVSLATDSLQRQELTPFDLSSLGQQAMVRCGICKKAVTRGKVIQCCAAQLHFSCLEHIGPLNKHNKPDIEKLLSCRDALTRYCTANDIEAKQLDTRAFFAYDHWKASTRSSRCKVEKDYCVYGYWSCKLCDLKNIDDGELFTFMELESQLFPDANADDVMQAHDFIGDVSAEIKTFTNVSTRSGDSLAFLDLPDAVQISLLRLPEKSPLFAHRTGNVSFDGEMGTQEVVFSKVFTSSQGDRFLLRSCFGTFLSQSSKSIFHLAEDIVDAVVFTAEPMGDNRIAYKTADGRYMSALDPQRIRGYAARAGAFETFEEVVITSSRSVLTESSGPSGRAAALLGHNADEIVQERQRRRTCVTLRDPYGCFLYADANGTTFVRTNEERNGWEVFEKVASAIGASPTSFFLLTMHGTFLYGTAGGGLRHGKHNRSVFTAITGKNGKIVYKLVEGGYEGYLASTHSGNVRCDHPISDPGIFVEEISVVADAAVESPANQLLSDESALAAEVSELSIGPYNEDSPAKVTGVSLESKQQPAQGLQQQQQQQQHTSEPILVNRHVGPTITVKDRRFGYTLVAGADGKVRATMSPRGLEKLTVIFDPVNKGYFALRTVHNTYLAFEEIDDEIIYRQKSYVVTQTQDPGRRAWFKTVSLGGQQGVGFMIKDTDSYLSFDLLKYRFSVSASLGSKEAFVDVDVGMPDAAKQPSVSDNETPPALNSTCMILLSNAGYADDEVSAALSSLSRKEVRELNRSFDFDYVKVLIDSARESKKQALVDATLADSAVYPGGALGAVGARDPAIEGGVGAAGMLNTASVVRPATPRARSHFDLRVRSAEHNSSASVRVVKGDGYEEIARSICHKLLLIVANDHLGLVRVDEYGWSVEISQDAQETTASEVCVCDLKQGDMVEVRMMLGCIGGRFRLAAVADKHNASQQEKVVELTNIYGGYRRIRGDGNCYYRAIVFGLFEHIILKGSREDFVSIREIFARLVFPPGILDDAHEFFLARLKRAADGSVWRNFEEFEADLLSESRGLDEALVRACKLLVATIVKERKDVPQNGLTLQDAILPGLEDVSSIDEFCEEYVLKMGVCAEGAHIDLAILPQALRCSSHIVLLHREKDVELQILDTPLPAGVAPLADVHLLFRPGHYDLLYQRGYFADADIDADSNQTESRTELVSGDSEVKKMTASTQTADGKESSSEKSSKEVLKGNDDIARAGAAITVDDAPGKGGGGGGGLAEQKEASSTRDDVESRFLSSARSLASSQQQGVSIDDRQCNGRAERRGHDLRSGGSNLRAAGGDGDDGDDDYVTVGSVDNSMRSRFSSRGDLQTPPNRRSSDRRDKEELRGSVGDGSIGPQDSPGPIGGGLDGLTEPWHLQNREGRLRSDSLNSEDKPWRIPVNSANHQIKSDWKSAAVLPGGDFEVAVSAKTSGAGAKPGRGDSGAGNGDGDTVRREPPVVVSSRDEDWSGSIARPAPVMEFRSLLPGQSPAAGRAQRSSSAPRTGRASNLSGVEAPIPPSPALLHLASADKATAEAWQLWESTKKVHKHFCLPRYDEMAEALSQMGFSMHDIIRGLTSRHCLNIEDAVEICTNLQPVESKTPQERARDSLGMEARPKPSSVLTSMVGVYPKPDAKPSRHGIDDTHLDTLLRSDSIHSEDTAKSKSSAASTVNQPHRAKEAAGSICRMAGCTRPAAVDEVTGEVSDYCGEAHEQRAIREGSLQTRAAAKHVPLEHTTAATEESTRYPGGRREEGARSRVSDGLRLQDASSKGAAHPHYCSCCECSPRLMHTPASEHGAETAFPSNSIGASPAARSSSPTAGRLQRPEVESEASFEFDQQGAFGSATAKPRPISAPARRAPAAPAGARTGSHVSSGTANGPSVFDVHGYEPDSRRASLVDWAALRRDADVYPILWTEEMKALVEKMVDGLGYPQARVVNAMTMQCYSLFSICKRIMLQDAGVSPNIMVVRILPRDMFANSQEDGKLLKLISTMVDMGYRRDDVVDCIVNKYISDASQIVDEVEKSNKATVERPRLDSPAAGFIRTNIRPMAATGRSSSDPYSYQSLTQPPYTVPHNPSLSSYSRPLDVNVGRSPVRSTGIDAHRGNYSAAAFNDKPHVTSTRSEFLDPSHGSSRNSIGHSGNFSAAGYSAQTSSRSNLVEASSQYYPYTASSSSSLRSPTSSLLSPSSLYPASSSHSSRASRSTGATLSPEERDKVDKIKSMGRIEVIERLRNARGRRLTGAEEMLDTKALRQLLLSHV